MPEELQHPAQPEVPQVNTDSENVQSPAAQLKQRLQHEEPHDLLETLAEEGRSPDRPSSENEEENNRFQPPRVIEAIHRAGSREGDDQNSISNIEMALLHKGAGGIEIDIEFTTDGVPVIFHSEKDKIDKDGKEIKGRETSKMTFAEFQQQCPDHMTIDGLSNLIDANWDLMRDKYLVFDFKVQDVKKLVHDVKTKFGLEAQKPQQIDPYKFLQKFGKLGDHAIVTAKDPEIVAKMLIAKRILGTYTQIGLAIPEPLSPEAAVRYADNLAVNVGLADVAAPESENEDLLRDLKPDLLHQYWPESLRKDANAEVTHGNWVMDYEYDEDDPDKPESVKVFKSKPVVGEIAGRRREARLSKFVKLAHRRGYKVIGGSSASPKRMDKMVNEWGLTDDEITDEDRKLAEEKNLNLYGVDVLMPNDPDNIPQVLQEGREANNPPTAESVVADDSSDTDSKTMPSLIRLTDEQRLENTSNMMEGDLAQEIETRVYNVPQEGQYVKPDRDPDRERYLRLASRVHSTHALRQQFGY